jgi:molybdopterin-binding protein
MKGGIFIREDDRKPSPLRGEEMGLESIGSNRTLGPRNVLILGSSRSIHLVGSLSFYNHFMAISARNKLRGKIEEIQLGDVMAHVVVRVGDNLIESVITRRSADELKLKKGDTVSAVVKATEVMIQKD